MCGRFVLKSLPHQLVEAFELPEENLPVIRYGRFNIAPSQLICAVRMAEVSKKPELVLLRWGLVPSWSKNGQGGLINARAETLTEKPSFRDSFKNRRCLILADGFYEWQKIGSKKQPFLFSVNQHQSFAFAGIFDRWIDVNGEALETCAIITTDANEVVGKVHDRMPVILSEAGQWRSWLDANSSDTDLKALLRPLPAQMMESHAVSPLMNSPRYDGPECVEPFDLTVNSA